MMISLDNNRLIGDFLEINAEIAYNETSAKGLKKLFIKGKSKKQRKKLVELLDKFVASNYILTRDNLYEAFVYFFDSKDFYTPKYLKIFKPDNQNDDMSSRIEGLIQYNYILCIIHLDSERKDFDLNMKYNNPVGESTKISISRTELKNDGYLSEEVADINRYLKAEIADFLFANIKSFLEDK